MCELDQDSVVDLVKRWFDDRSKRFSFSPKNEDHRRGLHVLLFNG
jgi:hypothetical protein